MMNEISQNMPGMVSVRPKGEAGSGGRVEARQPVSVLPSPAARQPSAGVEAEQVRTAEVSDQQLEEMVDDLNGFAQTVQRQLQFSVDQDNGKVVVKVVDAQTKDVIREIPPEEIRNMQKQLGEMSEKLFHKEESSGSPLLFQGKA